MLADKEIYGCTNILKNLDDSEIMSLLATVTSRQIIATTREEATNGIISFTPSPVALLKRRKIKRDLLYKYLYAEGIAVHPKDDKLVLIRKILEHWGSVPVGDEEAMEITEDQMSPEEKKVQNTATSTAEIPGQVDVDLQMAKAFAIWFYDMLNAIHPTSTQPASTDFGPQHFFPDCNMKLFDGPQMRTDLHQGAESVVRRLLALVTEEKLKFNPNTEFSGIEGKSEPHGLFTLVICGTLHLNGTLVGMFEQQFGLARDPDMQQNWRIKFTNLKIGTTQSKQVSTFTPCNVQHIV